MAIRPCARSTSQFRFNASIAKNPLIPRFPFKFIGFLSYSCGLNSNGFTDAHATTPATTSASNNPARVCAAIVVASVTSRVAPTAYPTIAHRPAIVSIITRSSSFNSVSIDDTEADESSSSSDASSDWTVSSPSDDESSLVPVVARDDVVLVMMSFIRRRLPRIIIVRDRRPARG